MGHLVAPPLVERCTVLCADLRCYGDSAPRTAGGRTAMTWPRSALPASCSPGTIAAPARSTVVALAAVLLARVRPTRRYAAGSSAMKLA
jgi:hypothetical protein